MPMTIGSSDRRLHMLGKISYYVLSVVIGIYLSMLVIGGGVLTTYYLDGQRVDLKNASASFIGQNIARLETRTIVDYDGLIWAFTGNETKIFPFYIFSGDLDTPVNVHNSLFAINTIIVVTLFWLLRQVFIRLRSNKAPS